MEAEVKLQSAIGAVVFRHRFALIIGLLGVILRVMILLNSSVWMDEAFSIDTMASTSFVNIITVIFNDDGAPAYYFFLRIWVLIFGSGEIACAALSTLFSTLSLIGVYFFACCFFRNSMAPLLALAIVAFSPTSLTHSSNIRFYALLECLSVLSYGYYWFFMNRSEKRVPYILYSVLGVYTHTFFFFSLFAQLLTTLVFFRKKFMPFFKAAVWMFVIYLPWMPVVLRQIYLRLQGKMGSVIPSLSNYGGVFGSFFGSIAQKLFAFGSDNFAVLLGISVICLISLFLYIKHRKYDEWKTFGLFGAAYLFSVGIPICISIYKPIFWLGKFDIIASPLVAWCFGFYISVIFSSLWVCFIIIFLLFSGMKHTHWLWSGNLSGDRDVVLELKDTFNEKTAIVNAGIGYFALDYYLEQYKIETGRRYVFPSALIGQPPYVRVENFVDKRSEFKEEAKFLVKAIQESQANAVFLFFTPFPNFDVIIEVFDQNFIREWGKEAPIHPWGPNYFKIIYYKVPRLLNEQG